MGDPEKNEVTARTLSTAGEAVYKTGNLEFVAEQGENGGKTTYQEASGAPVEAHSPLGTRVQWFTIIFLNLGQMIGTGVFSTPGSILKGTGSVGLSLMYWLIGFVVSLAGLAVYLELGSYFPSRSGAEVVYLEQAYPRPRYFFPVAFAVQSVILSFSSSNAIVLATYVFRMAGREGSPWEQKGVAIAGYTLAVILGISSNRLSLLFSDVVGFIKLVGLFILVKLLLLIMPWVPPKTGATGGSVSFWYATYCVAGIGIILTCGVYYYFWINLIPQWRGYAIRQKRVVYEDDGAVTHQLVRVQKADLERWDAEHDANGNKLI